MKYKVGDRVKMRSLQWCKENIFNNEDKYPPELFEGIEKFCGKILTISDAVDKSKYVDEGYYNMVEDTKWDYYWTDEMIEGLVEEEVFIKANDIYNEEYSKGEYCHEQSFKWGFQEGYNYSHENDKLEISLKEGYQFKDENGNVINATKIVLEKKSPKTNDIIKWLREHDMTKYIGILYTGLCSVTFDTEKLIKDITEMIGDE